MNSLGIYFGPKTINIVETKGKKLIRHTSIPQATAVAGDLEGKVAPDVKMIETVALFKDELRRNKIDVHEAALCLSGNDLIIRTFEVPQLPREELQSAINFEAKKYIPFKVEDLITDFDVQLDKVSRTNQVLFVGIKKDTLDRYISLLSQLDIKISSIEYSAFSLFRSLKLSGLKDDGVVGLIGSDLLGEDELNFTVFENGYPLFSRDISLSAGPEESLKATDKEAGMALERLKTEIRVSLDYYNRKFPTKTIRKIFLVSDKEYRFDLEAYITEIGPSVQFVDAMKNIDLSLGYSLSFVKGFSSSLYKTIKSGIKVDLLGAKQKGLMAKERVVPIEAGEMLEGLKIDYKIIFLGILICAATYGYGIYRMQPVKKDIADLISSRPQVISVNPEASYEELAGKEANFKRKLEVLNDIVMKQLYVTKPLNGIPRAVPKGVWLTRFTFTKADQEKSDVSLEGASYLGDSDDEFKSVNQFVSNLKNDPDFTKYFKNISVVFIDRKPIGKITATNFSISCKTY